MRWNMMSLKMELIYLKCNVRKAEGSRRKPFVESDTWVNAHLFSWDGDKIRRSKKGFQGLPVSTLFISTMNIIPQKNFSNEVICFVGGCVCVRGGFPVFFFFWPKITATLKQFHSNHVTFWKYIAFLILPDLEKKLTSVFSPLPDSFFNGSQFL